MLILFSPSILPSLVTLLILLILEDVGLLLVEILEFRHLRYQLHNLEFDETYFH